MMTAAFHRPSAFSVNGHPIQCFPYFVCNEIYAEWFWCASPALPNLLLPSTVTPGVQATQKSFLNSNLTHKNHVFHGEMTHILCTWAGISTYSLVSVTLLKNLKHLVYNFFPQQKNHDWLKPHYTVHTQVVLLSREQTEARNGIKKGTFKDGVLTSWSLTITSANKSILYCTGHRLRMNKAFWSGKRWFVWWLSHKVPNPSSSIMGSMAIKHQTVRHG